jgi:hypothetical protein
MSQGDLESPRTIFFSSSRIIGSHSSATLMSIIHLGRIYLQTMKLSIVQEANSMKKRMIHSYSGLLIFCGAFMSDTIRLLYRTTKERKQLSPACCRL